MPHQLVLKFGRTNSEVASESSEKVLRFLGEDTFVCKDLLTAELHGNIGEALVVK